MAAQVLFELQVLSVCQALSHRPCVLGASWRQVGTITAGCFTSSGHVSLQVDRGLNTAGDWRLQAGSSYYHPLLLARSTSSLQQYLESSMRPSLGYSGPGQGKRPSDLWGWVRYANPKASGQPLERNTVCNYTH